MDTKPSIQQVDNFFPENIAENIIGFCEDTALYRYGETDNREQPPTGLACDIYHADSNHSQLAQDARTSEESKLVYNYFIKYIHEKYPGFWNDYVIYRLYINVFSPRENAYFHTDSVGDSDQWTFLYYPILNFDYDLNQGGWTEFDLDSKIIGVPPLPNSLCRFSSFVNHRATPFKDHHRFTIAIKCINKNELN